MECYHGDALYVLVNCPPRESMPCIGSWHMFASLEEIVLGGGCMEHAR